jgi:hypothetical protein
LLVLGAIAGPDGERSVAGATKPPRAMFAERSA